MLASIALESLSLDLAKAIESLGLADVKFGVPDLVEKPAKQAEEIFQGYAKAKPSKEDAYAAALAFLRGTKLDEWQRDMVASALCVPVREQSGTTVVGAQERFLNLLETYRDEVKRGDLWRLTWHGLLYSYFNFDLDGPKNASVHAGWEALREFLAETWPFIDKQTEGNLVPAWVSVIRQEVELLSKQPVDKYAKAFLRGDTGSIDRLASDLGIPPSSWFWHALVLSAVKHATTESDTKFRERLPQLLDLIRSRPGFRDEALELILNRYHACQGAPADEHLRDFVCQPTVWKNPKLKAAGIATAWNRVPDAVWKMVLAWVNEQNLKDFFDILAARNKADEGRLAFWSKYLKQISWTRLLFGADTMALQKANAEVRNLIAREEGSYAQLTGKPEVDAFMMQLGPYVVIEFSKKPNACYVYEADQLPFEPYDRYYDGGTSDLAAGYRSDVNYALRIVHRAGWDDRAEIDLRQLGIQPDARSATSTIRTTGTTDTTAKSAKTSYAKPGRPSISAVSKIHGGPDLALVKAIVARFPRAIVDDRRNLPSGGRLWVADRLQRTQLSEELEGMGFKWSDRRLAWYFPENQ
jgi:hypothetical protein